MKMTLLACVASAALLCTAASAQDVPKLSDFLSSCYRDSGACKLKIKDYVVASKTQKVICPAKDVSDNEAANEILRWLRSDEALPLKGEPYDDGLFSAAIKLYPCTPVPPPPPPAAAPAGDQPATPPQP